MKATTTRTDGSIVLAENTGGDAWADSQVSRRVLARLSQAPIQQTVIRAYRPRPTAAFSRADANRPGFPDALMEAAARGYVPLIRPAGGTAVVYDSTCLIFDVLLSRRAADPKEDYEWVAASIADALREVGIDARVGALAGEYCPGSYSVNVGGVRKVVGVAQRVSGRAVLVSSVVMVRRADHLREAVDAIYAALGYAWDRRTFGALAEDAAAVDVAQIAEVLTRRFGGASASLMSVADYFAHERVRRGTE